MLKRIKSWALWSGVLATTIAIATIVQVTIYVLDRRAPYRQDYYAQRLAATISALESINRLCSTLTIHEDLLLFVNEEKKNNPLRRKLLQYGEKLTNEFHEATVRAVTVHMLNLDNKNKLFKDIVRFYMEYNSNYANRINRYVEDAVDKREHNKYALKMRVKCLNTAKTLYSIEARDLGLIEASDKIESIFRSDQNVNFGIHPVIYRLPKTPEEDDQ